MDFKKVKFIVFSAILVCGGFFSAQEVSKTSQNDLQNLQGSQEKMILTVDDAVDYALKNSKSLKSSAIDLEIKKRASENSWNTFLPSASLSGTAARTTEIDSTLQSANGSLQMMNLIKQLHAAQFQAMGQDATPSALYEDEEKYHWAVVGNLGLSWAFNAAMIESISVAKKQYESGLISWEQTVRETEVNIRKLFYGLLLAQENLKIQKESMNNAEARWRQAEINYRNGTVPRLSVLNSQVTYENMRPTILTAENTLKQNKETFGFLLGLPYNTDFDLSGTIDVSYVEVNADELFEKYVEQNNDIKSLKKNIELIKAGITATNLSTFTPSLALNYSYQPLLYSFGEWKSGDEIADSGSFSITLAYSNLFDMLPWSSNMQKLKDSKQQLAQAELGLEQLYQNAEIEVHKLCDNLTVSRANIEAMQNNVTLAQEAYDSTLRAYNNGTQELLQVRDSESSLNQAKLGLMNERYNYISAILDLETKLNIKLGK